MERYKSELELMYDKKVEGLIIQARARWHEHGEKNSKYFLNLEKRNYIEVARSDFLSHDTVQL